MIRVYYAVVLFSTPFSTQVLKSAQDKYDGGRVPEDASRSFAREKSNQFSD